MNVVNILILFLIGLCVGSFLNMLITRLPRGEEILFKRSHCDGCGKTLGFFDLIPIFSFIFLSGRCRYCKRKIPLHNLWVELLSGLLFVYVGSRGIFLREIIYLLMVFSILLSILVIDLNKRIIPDSLVLFLMLITIFYETAFLPGRLGTHLLSGLLNGLFFGGLWLLTKGRGMGMGDVKYAFFMGLFLGWPKILVAFYAAFLTGAVISLILVFMGRKKFKSKIAFGPFLVTATFIAYFYGENLISMAKKFFYF